MGYLPDTRIRYTMDKLGLVQASGDVNNGDTGRMIGPMRDEADWYLTEPDRYPGYVCPVHVSMFEVAA